MNEPVEFAGFSKQTLPFLKALGFHQNREWFHENKALYDQVVKTPMGDLVETLTRRFEKAGVPLKGERKTSLYRVNRDVRFSKNKEPYNTHGSLILTRNGNKKENGFLYLHFSNERVFIASGFYNLEGDEMRAFRDLILREKETMIKLVDAMQARGYLLDMSSALKRNPRGFETVDDERLQGFVRLRNFTFIRELTDKDLLKADLVDKMLLLGECSVPFLNFGWRAIDPLREINES